MIYVIQQLSGWYVLYVQNSLNNFISRHLVPKYQHFLNNSTKSLLQHCIANKIESYTIHAGFCIVVYILLYIEFKSKQRAIHFLMKSAFKCVVETYFVQKSLDRHLIIQLPILYQLLVTLVQSLWLWTVYTNISMYFTD